MKINLIVPTCNANIVMLTHVSQLLCSYVSCNSSNLIYIVCCTYTNKNALFMKSLFRIKYKRPTFSMKCIPQGI